MKFPPVLNDFLYKEKEPIVRKLNYFSKNGKNKLHLVSDFDRTLTKGFNDLRENISAWEALRSHLSLKNQVEYSRFYKKYRILEVRKKMKIADAVVWWEEILSLVQKDRLKLSDIVKDVDIKLPIRPGAKELFKICGEKNIPTVIISAGIKDIIEVWCQKFDIYPTMIISTNLTFSPEGYINGWGKDSLVHALNKKEKGHKEMVRIKSARPNTILLGDSLDDISMATGENVLKIAICNPRKDDKKEIFKDFIENFDLVIKKQTLYPLIKILNLF